MAGFFTRNERKDPRPKGRRSPQAGRRRANGPSIDTRALQEAGCASCPLQNADCLTPKMPAYGHKQPWVYFLGEAPGAEEDEQGRPFVGRSGKMLKSAIPPDWLKDCRFGNSVCCHPPKNKTPGQTELECCRRRVIADIEKSEPLVVVGVGGTALTWLVGPGQPIQQWRGRLMQTRIGKHACWFFPILHPAFILRGGGGQRDDSDDWRRVFNRDLGRLFDQLEDLPEADTPDPEELKKVKHFTRETGVAAAIKFLEHARQQTLVAVDIEATALRPYGGNKMLAMSIALENGETGSFLYDHPHAPWAAQDFKALRIALRRFLESPVEKVAHNLACELEWFYSEFGILRGHFHDTMIGAYVLDERRGGLSLDNVSLEYLGFACKDVYNADRSRLVELPIKTLLDYNGLDSAVTLPIWKMIRERIAREKLGSTYERHITRIPSLVAAQAKGVRIDFDVVDSLEADLTAEIEQQKRDIQKMPEVGEFREKHGTFNPLSPDQVAVMFRDVLGHRQGSTVDKRTGVEKYSTAAGVLEEIGGPLAEAIVSLRKTSKLWSTYVRGYAKGGENIHPDGLVHSTFNTTFTVTGRLSSSNPNLQNLPKRDEGAAKIRRMIVPSPGNILLSADYGQIEARVIAMMSGDKFLVKALWDDYDIHLYWAEWVAKRSSVIYRKYDRSIKKLRAAVKNKIVFPAFYGSAEYSIATSMEFDKRTSHDMFAEFWDTFDGVKLWQQELYAFYKRHGYIECLTGRRRREPMTLNQLLNAGVQGTASDIVVEAGDRLSVRAEREERPELQFNINIHDDLTFNVPKKLADEAQDTIVKEMLAVRYDWINVPITIEVSRGGNLFEMKEVGKFSSNKKAG